MPYALGAGAFAKDGEFAVGEGLIYEEKAYIFVPGATWTHQEYIQTPFLMGVERKPAALQLINTQQSISQLYEHFLTTYSKGFAVVGEVHFSQLEMAYLCLPPIYHENVNEHSDKYWKQEKGTRVSARIFGVILPYLNKKGFYHNPNETQQETFYSHTHALLSSSTPRHLLTQSTLTKGRLWVEEIA